MDEFKSQRWLLYLGNQSLEAMVYQITTTTKLEYYTGSGKRVKHNYFKIPAKIGGLEKDSILDLTLFFECIPESLMNKCKIDIEKKGSFKQDYINKFVKHLKIDPHILPIVKKDIYRYLREAGYQVSLGVCRA